MRKHLYRKSAWKEGVPSSLNYRSVLSGALYGSRRLGGLTAHPSLPPSAGSAPAGAEDLDTSLPGTAPGPGGPAAPMPAPALPGARPCVSRAAGGGTPALAHRSTCGPLPLPPTSRMLSSSVEQPQAQRRQTAPSRPPPRHLQGPQGHPEDCPRIGVGTLSTITPRQPGQRACKYTPNIPSPPGGYRLRGRRAQPRVPRSRSRRWRGERRWRKGRMNE